MQSNFTVLKNNLTLAVYRVDNRLTKGRNKKLKTKNQLAVVVSILTLALSTLACGAFSASSATQEPVQPASATEPPASMPAGSSTDPSAVVPCSKLVPPDELKNLLINITPTLAENSYPGGTSCVWSYTNSAGQSSTLSLKVDFSSDGVSLWEATRKSELSNEPSDLVVTGIDGLVDESYAWSSKATGLYVVYARQGDKTLIMRFNPADVLYMNNESGIIDMAERFFSRF